VVATAVAAVNQEAATVADKVVAEVATTKGTIITGIATVINFIPCLGNGIIF
jgi:hypothetical protein